MTQSYMRCSSVSVHFSVNRSALYLTFRTFAAFMYLFYGLGTQ